MYSLWETKSHEKAGNLIGHYKTLRGAKIAAGHLCFNDSTIEILNTHYVIAKRVRVTDMDGNITLRWIDFTQKRAV